MKSLSSVGLGLSIVFGCLLLALVAELYYLLWWKRRISNGGIGDDYSNPAKELFYMFCLKKPSSLRHSEEVCSSIRITDTLVQQEQNSSHQLQRSTGKDFLLKPFGDNRDTVEAEIMRLHSVLGPPRFLFTIVEETKEDLESEDGKSRGDNKSRGRSLSDVVFEVETPYLTPLASPPLFTPPLTPSNPLLFESSKDGEFNKIRPSPPPKFKLLQDAEEELHRRKTMEEAEDKVQNSDGLSQEFASSKLFQEEEEDEEEEGPFITIIVDKNKERELDYNQQRQQFQQHYSSTTSQALPLASSPSNFKSAAKKSSDLSLKTS